jgi:hypothetical protein
MPAKQMSAKQKSKDKLRAFYACQEEKAAGQRDLCSHLLFWKFCGHKKCLRVRACAVDCKECFDRFWPLVPEELKISIRTMAKAQQARLSPDETAAEIERELARWRATMAPRDVPQTLPEPAPQVPTIARAVPRAPNPHVPSPRLRVL